MLIGVDGGADALLDVGLSPTSSWATSTPCRSRAMDVGAEHVHHVHPDGRNPGFEELQEFGKDYVEFVVEGTSEDAAMLLAYEAGAKLIVAVGTHDTMVEFLDKGRAGMSSHLPHPAAPRPDAGGRQGRGPPLRAHRAPQRPRRCSSMAALIVMLVITIVSQPLQVFLEGIWLTLRDFWFRVTGTF